MVDDFPGAAGQEQGRPATAGWVARYGTVVLLVAAAALLAEAVSGVVPGPGLTLVFVLPVVIAGAWLGWGPSLLAAGGGVLAFDFFFTQPFYSLRIDDPAEIWAAGLFLATAAIVGAVAWEARRRAFDARRAAEQAEALHALAHAVIAGQPAVPQAAALALERLFSAPAVVLSRKRGRLTPDAFARATSVTDAELRAADDALTSGTPLRAGIYPHDRSRFDMWPVGGPGDNPSVLAVDFSRSPHERPDDADRLLEIVAGYLAQRTPWRSSHGELP